MICFDSTIIGDQNKLPVIKTFDNCDISKADVWAISWLILNWLSANCQKAA